MHTYRVILTQEPEGGYTVTVPSLPGCITYGDNVDHAMEMAKEAIEGYLEVLKEQGDEIPDDSHSLEYSLTLASWTVSNFPSLTPKELVKILENKGFVLKRIHGSHHYFIHPESKKIIVVPMHNKDLAKGTLHAILKQAGIDKDNFWEFQNLNAERHL
jgi:antitoxin HicB